MKGWGNEGKGSQEKKKVKNLSIILLIDGERNKRKSKRINSETWLHQTVSTRTVSVVPF